MYEVSQADLGIWEVTTTTHAEETSCVREDKASHREQ